MAEVVLFHHVQGLTDGVRAFAGELRAGGHTVHTPDLFDGQRPATIEDGVALVESMGDEVLTERVDRAVADLPEGLVYAGFSFGGAMAQRLAQTRPGARRELVETVGPELGELFVYPGDRHLFTDSSLPSYGPDATALVVRRSREFLDR